MTDKTKPGPPPARTVPPVPKGDPAKLLADVMKRFPNMTRAEAIEAIKKFGGFTPDELNQSETFEGIPRASSSQTTK